VNKPTKIMIVIMVFFTILTIVTEHYLWSIILVPLITLLILFPGKKEVLNER
jgi:hypothetical protein